MRIDLVREVNRGAMTVEEAEKIEAADAAKAAKDAKKPTTKKEA